MGVSDASVEAASGAVASVISLLATYPLKTIYTLQAISAANSRGKGGGSAASAASLGIFALVRKYKLRGLYVGIEPNIFESALSSACYFYLYAKLRDIAVRQAHGNGVSPHQHKGQSPLAVTSSSAAPNMEQQADSSNDDNASTDTFLSANSASRAGSTTGNDSAQGKEVAVGSSPLQDGTNASIRSLSSEPIINNGGSSHTTNISTRDQSIGVLASLIVAALAGIGNQLITMPISLVATRIQSSQKLLPNGKVSRPHTLNHVVSSIFREDGVLGFWKGLLPALVLVSNPAIQYMLYEQFLMAAKQWKAARRQRAAEAAASGGAVVDAVAGAGATAGAASVTGKESSPASSAAVGGFGSTLSAADSSVSGNGAVGSIVSDASRPATAQLPEDSQGPSTPEATSRTAGGSSSGLRGGSGPGSSSSSSSGIGSGSGGTYGVPKYVNVSREIEHDEHDVVDEDEMQRMEGYFVESQQRAGGAAAAAAPSAGADTDRGSSTAPGGSNAEASDPAAAAEAAAQDKTSETANALAGALTGGAAGAAAGVVTGSAASAVGAAVAGVMVGAVTSGVTGAATVAVAHALASKRHSSHQHQQSKSVAVQGVRLSPLEIFLCSSAAKIGATVATYPLIVVKSRLQAANRASDPRLRYAGTVDAVRQILTHEGLAGFFGGLEAKVYQTALGAGLTLMIKDRVGSAVRGVLAANKPAVSLVKLKKTASTAADAASGEESGKGSQEGAGGNSASGSRRGVDGKGFHGLAGCCAQVCTALGGSEEVAARAQLLVALLLQQATHVVA